MNPDPDPGIETRASWIAACTVLAILMVSSGTPWVVVVAMKPIAADLATTRSGPALAGSLSMLGGGTGAIAMGWMADRIGVRPVAAFGIVMVCVGLVVAASGGLWRFYLAYAFLIGLLGHACLYAPLQVYVTRWFDRHRGSALALVASGPYVGGALWPSVFVQGVQAWGWRPTMIAFGVLQLVLVLPLVVLLLRPLPAALRPRAQAGAALPGATVLGLPPSLALLALAVAALLCCIPMALPLTHLVALCSDLGITPARGVGMLAVLQGCAFFARQFWGWLADRIGGLRTLLAGSACQALTIAAFLATQDEVGLFAAAAGFGLGYAGIIPAYTLTVRELFPAAAAGWQVPLVALGATFGMAGGAWAGAALYDAFGTYAAAFAVGLVCNLLNVLLLAALVLGDAREPAPCTIAPAGPERA